MWPFARKREDSDDWRRKWCLRLDLRGAFSPRDTAKIAWGVSCQLDRLERLNDLHAYEPHHQQLDDWRDKLGGEFAELSRDEALTGQEFDCLMDELYDWANTKVEGGKRVCRVVISWDPR